MQIESISVKGFKALKNVTFEPGNVNVFIGANGAGKSTVLEAIGVLSAAMTDRVDNSSLDRKGIRLSTPGLYKSSFRDNKKAPTIGFEVQWKDGADRITYDVHLNNPNDDSAWRYHSEALYLNEEKLWGRSGNSQIQYDNRVGMLMLAQEEKLGIIKPSAEQFRNYAIYQPSTPILRGISPDKYQAIPMGLCGGRLAEAIEELLYDEDGDLKFGDLYIEEVLELVDWAAGFSVAAPKKSSINSAVPTSRRVIEFQDRFMREKDRFTAYDASEGSLYVLFLLCLAMHDKSPMVFSIDNFDQAMNPRLARATTKLFCDIIKEKNKTVFITTHNPLVLDGLQLSDPAVRLFTVERSSFDGSAKIKRIEVSEDLIKLDQPLSRLWINGRLGGVPNLL
ncbi:MAG: AAA family ATPase [Lachnospiraceae bacterium]|nr:AAA family ATPase [Lachnospiraceae bacterium]